MNITETQHIKSTYALIKITMNSYHYHPSDSNNYNSDNSTQTTKRVDKSTDSPKGMTGTDPGLLGDGWNHSVGYTVKSVSRRQRLLAPGGNRNTRPISTCAITGIFKKIYLFILIGG